MLFYLAHPGSYYYGVAKVERDQVEDYIATVADTFTCAYPNAGLNRVISIWNDFRSAPQSGLVG